MNLLAIVRRAVAGIALLVLAACVTSQGHSAEVASSPPPPSAEEVGLEFAAKHHAQVLPVHPRFVIDLQEAIARSPMVYGSGDLMNIRQNVAGCLIEFSSYENARVLLWQLDVDV